MADAVIDQNEIKDIVEPQVKAPLLDINIVKKEVDNTHYYFVNDEFYPGVTSILDEAAPMGYGLRQFLLNNTPEDAQEIKERTAGLGSKLHDGYERLLNGMELNLASDYPTTKEKKHLLSFYQWHKDFKPKDIQAEQTVASLEFKFAGTLDLACRIDGKLTIIDFKTGAAIYFSHFLQLAAYKKAYEEMYGEKVEGLYILRTGSRHKCGYEWKEITTPFQGFLNVYKTYLDLHDGKIPPPPLIDVYPDTLKLDL